MKAVLLKDLIKVHGANLCQLTYDKFAATGDTYYKMKLVTACPTIEEYETAKKNSEAFEKALALKIKELWASNGFN